MKKPKYYQHSQPGSGEQGPDVRQPDRCGLQPPEPPHPPSSILPYSFCRSPRAALGVFCTASSLFSISHHITAAPASSPATGYTSSDPQLTPSPSFSGYSLTLMPCFVGPGSKLEGALALRGSQTLALCSALLRVCVLDEPELPVPVC